jgi:hypothetical protein
MNDQQREVFEQKIEKWFEDHIYTGANAIARFRQNVADYVDVNNSGRVSDSAFLIVEKAMVEVGELRPIVVEEESELTLQEYRSMPVRQIQLKYRSDPGFKAGVESLIARGLI